MIESSYTKHLERIIDLKDQEINMYKSFIEELGVKIKETVETSREFDENNKEFHDVHFKVIEIPQFKFFVEMQHNSWISFNGDEYER